VTHFADIGRHRAQSTSSTTRQEAARPSPSAGWPIGCTASISPDTKREADRRRSFILTDRKSLDTNIRDDIEKFTHLQHVVGLARKAEDLPRYLKERKPIIVTTQQKFAWVLEEIETRTPASENHARRLPDRRGAPFAGRTAWAPPFVCPSAQPEDPDIGRRRRTDGEGRRRERIAAIIREHDRNQLFVAFTATPAPATVTLFGAPFDTYSRSRGDRRRATSWMWRRASSPTRRSINLHCSTSCPLLARRRLYPKGVVSKALQNVAYQDDGLIQYKAEVMLRIFEERRQAAHRAGSAKAMIVATSRVAGLELLP
jgi:type I restriction enzyme R subunit